MKKIISLIASIAVLGGIHLFAVEPMVMVSLVVPGIMYAESSGESEILISEELSQNDIFALTLPERVVDSDIKLSSVFSINPIRLAGSAWDLYDIFQSSNSTNYNMGSGSVLFNPFVDYITGKVSLEIQYDDVNIKTREENSSPDYSLDGKVNITVSFFTDSLFDVTISTKDISISGNKDFSNNSLTIQFVFNESQVYGYLKSFDIETARRMVGGIIMRSPLFEKLGFESESDFEDVISFAEKNKALDIIDSLASILLATSDNSLSGGAIFSMITTPVLYENGIKSKDIDLSKGVERALMISEILN